jgi:hypothetical protein
VDRAVSQFTARIGIQRTMEPQARRSDGPPSKPTAAQPRVSTTLRSGMWLVGALGTPLS